MMSICLITRLFFLPVLPSPLVHHKLDLLALLVDSVEVLVRLVDSVEVLVQLVDSLDLLLMLYQLV